MSTTAPVQTAVVMTDQESKPVQAVIATILAVLTGLYMLPWAIAALRGKHNSGAIGFINLLLGWTIVGYVFALVLAVTPHGVRVVE